MDKRPDPERFLKLAQAEESARRRGRLKLFFGANPGVGKTYAMLEAARAIRKEGQDVVVGLVETHGRVETNALLEGLDILPRKEVDYKGVRLKEFDIDAALARKPNLILVDELAHTNAPGSRHPKRWQDVEELLDAGINVFTTLNVQHWESLNDVVAKITGVIVQETVPDTLLERAYELELIDLSPEDLLKRLKDGKVYKGELAERAADHFFKPENLAALRELALRHTAERVDQQMEALKGGQAGAGVWSIGDRLLVGITGSPMSPRLVRATARLAVRLRGEWIALYVETPPSLEQSAEAKQRLHQTFKLVEQLGGEMVTVSGNHVVQELLHYARSRNVTKIILGKPARPLWREWLFGSVVNQVARACGDIDLYVISGVGSGFSSRRVDSRAEPPSWPAMSQAVGVVFFCTLINWPLFQLFDRVNLVMVYLLGMMGVAYRLGRRPALVAAVLSVLAFDFFYVPPHLTFAISDAQYLFTFAVMFAVGFLISELTGRLSQQTDALRRREQRTGMLYRFSRALSETPDPEQLIQVAWKQMREFYQLPLLIFTKDRKEGMVVKAGDASEFGLTQETFGAVEWVMLHSEPAGTGTDTLVSLGALFLPMKGLNESVGVLAIKPTDPSFFKEPEQYQLLETLAGEIGGALESTRMSESAGRAAAEIETQRLRNLLLTSFSYDLRDPLRRLSRRVQEVMDPASPLTDKSREALWNEIRDEADRIEKMTADLLKLMDQGQF